ncbi:GP179 protein, partial [Nothoprocta ornata]|nr:GP179 protein [Nothoprocta ornata]
TSRTSPSSEKAEICPWERQESGGSSRADICPWEAAAAPSDQGKAKQVPGGPSKGDKRFTRQAALASPARSMESGSGGERAAAGPRESPGTGQPPGTPALPKASSGTAQSAEICPWETQEREGGTKAEICPWETAEPPPVGGRLKEARGGPSTGSGSASPRQ